MIITYIFSLAVTTMVKNKIKPSLTSDGFNIFYLKIKIFVTKQDFALIYIIGGISHN